MCIIEAIDKELARLHEIYHEAGDQFSEDFFKTLIPLHQSLLEISQQIKEGNK